METPLSSRSARRRGRGVVVFAGSFYPREGGAERQLRQVLSKLRARGIPVSVITQQLPASPVRTVLQDGTRIWRLGAPGRLNRYSRLSQLAFVARAIQLAVRINPEVVISLQLGTASTAAAVVARLGGRPHYLRLTGDGTASFRSESVARRNSVAGRAIVAAVAVSRPVVVAPAHHLLRDFEESFPRYGLRLEMVPNGVARVTAIESRDQEVIWYARRGEVKSIDAFISLAEALPDVEFTVIGEISSSVRLPDNVSYLGWLQEPERAIARHRVLLNTSPVEGMPNTALQALAAGLRVVAYDNAGIRELATNYPGYVHFVRGGDIRGMSSVLKTVLGLPVGEAQSVPTFEDALKAWYSLLGECGD